MCGLAFAFLLAVSHEAHAAVVTVTACLVESTSAGIPGQTVEYRVGTWQPFGVTGPDGCVQADIDVSGSTSVRVRHEGRTLQVTQNPFTDPLYTFATVLVTTQFTDSVGNPLAGGVVQHNASSWQPFGTTDAAGLTTKELLPGNTSVRLR